MIQSYWSLNQQLRKKHLLTKNVQNAIKQAVSSHSKQIRDDGSNYLTSHIFPIVSDLLQNIKRVPALMENIIILALLHDTLEDDLNYSEIKLLKVFDKKILNQLKILTKPRIYNFKKQTEEEKYIQNSMIFEKIMKSTYSVRIVKLADRFNNISSIDLLRTTRPEKFTRYIKEGYNLVLPLAKITSKKYFKKIKLILDKLSAL